MTPREHAAKAADDFGDEHLGSSTVTAGIEAAIRAAGAPLAEALRRIAAIDWRKDHGSDFACAFGEAQDVAEAALAAWEAK